MQRAAAHAAGAATGELIGDGTADGVAIESGQHRRPRVLTTQQAAHRLAAPTELVTRAGLEDDHPEIAAGQLERHDSAGRSGTNDRDVAIHGQRSERVCRYASGRVYRARSPHCPGKLP